MSACFIGLSLPVFEVTEERLNWFTKYVHGLEERELDTAWEAIYGHPVEKDYHEARMAVIEAIQEAGNGQGGEGMIRPYGLDYQIWITGGLSHGDRPTDVSEYYELLCYLPLDATKKFVEWAREDMPTPLPRDCEVTRIAANMWAKFEDLTGETGSDAPLLS